MWYLGIDLHRRTVVIAIMNDAGVVINVKHFLCTDIQGIQKCATMHLPYKAVIEASGTYRWLYDMLSPHGQVLVAHPRKLRAIWSGRAKTDKKDAVMLAKLLRVGLIPESYVPPHEYQVLRDLTRSRASLVRDRTLVENKLHALLARVNVISPYKNTFGPRGRSWLRSVKMDESLSFLREELLERWTYYDGAIKRLNKHLEKIVPFYPQIESLMDIHGIAEYSALLIVAEIGEPGRFQTAKQVGAYAGLVPSVNQSGESEMHGAIAKEGSRWLRWILVEAAMKVTKKDEQLKKFYTRIRRRAGWKRARIAVARKLAEICWKRLRRWEREQQAA